MNAKLNKIFLFLFFVLLLGYFILPVMADQSYGIKDNSKYVWQVNESGGGNVTSYRLTAHFNLHQRNVNITEYYYANDSSMTYSISMNQFGKFIMASQERHGDHNLFYTGQGALNFPRHVLMEDDALSTQIVEYSTGITLYYTSATEEYILISGSLPLSWLVWIILGFTIGLSSYVLILLYKKGKYRSQALVYDIKILNYL